MKTNELFLVTYITDKEYLSQILDSKIQQIQKFAFIVHDKDIYEKDVINSQGEVIHQKGDLKEPHTHIYLKLKSTRNSNEICNWFTKLLNGERCNCLCERVRDRKSCYKYLTHDTDSSKNKSPYLIEDIVSYNIENLEEEEPVDNTYYIIQDMIEHVPIMTMIKKYGRDFVYHYDNYKKVIRAFYEEPLGNYDYGEFGDIDTYKETDEKLPFENN